MRQRTRCPFAKDLHDDPDALRAASVATLREHGFAPEVLNRIDRILCLRHLAVWTLRVFALWKWKR